MFDSAPFGGAFNAISATSDLEAARQVARFDMEDTIVQMLGLVEKFKKMKKGHKEPCERVVASATLRTMSLMQVASELGIKKFYDDPPPFQAFQLQLKFVDNFLTSNDMSPIAAFGSRGRVDQQTMKLVWDLEHAHNEARDRMLRSYAEGETPFDLYEDKLGERGGYSDIHVAQYRKVGQTEFQTVAVKHLRPKGIDINKTQQHDMHERMSKRLFREKEPWQLVHHPHILPFLDFATVPRHVLISPWCRNGNIGTFLHNNPAANRPLLMAQTAAGIDFLHTRHPPIVHADIKPDNILVNDIAEAVIADFGQAKVVTGYASLWETESGFKGTPAYMAPELYEDTDVEATIPSDVYAFTFVLLQILSGNKPYYNVKMNVILAVQMGVRPKPQDYPEPTCHALWPLLEAGWNAEPRARPGMSSYVHRLGELVMPTAGVSPHEARGVTWPAHEVPHPHRNDSTASMISARSVSAHSRVLSTPSSTYYRSLNEELQRLFCAVHGSHYDVWKGTYKVSVNGPLLQVAIKYLRPRVVHSERPEDLKRFDHELDVWRQLDHPHVMSLLDSSANGMYLVSPWCGFGNITQYTRMNQGVDAMGLLAQVADGIDYLHSGPFPLLHGNLNPENIYIDDDRKAVIGGFGTALTPSEFNTQAGWALAQSVPNIRYTAPEVLNGVQLWYSSDIYSLALISLEVLSSQQPFAGLIGARLLRAVAGGVKPQLRDYTDSATASLWPAFEMWWNDDPQSRPTARMARETIENVSRTVPAFQEITMSTVGSPSFPMPMPASMPW